MTCSNPLQSSKPLKLQATLRLPTYGCKVVFIVSDRLNKDANAILRKLKQETFNEEVEGVTISTDIDVYWVIVNSKYLTHNTIAHELHHAVCRVTGDRGIEDEETRSWLIGHMSEFVYKTLDKKKLTVKHG